MKIFDMHCHAGYTNNMPRAGDADNLLDIERSCEFSDVCVQTIVMWYPQNILRNLLGVQLKAENPERMRIFGGIVFPEPGTPRPDLASQAKRLIDAGFDGIKLFGKPTVRAVYDLPFTHPSYRELYGYCAENGVPILFHIGDPAEFWDPKRCTEAARAAGWYYGEGAFPSLERLYDEAEGFLSDFPRLDILFSHMLFLSGDLPRLGAMLERYPGMRVDVTPGVEMYHSMNRAREEARDFFVRRAGRILFGTDNAGNAGDATANKESNVHKVERMRRFFETEEAFVWGKAGLAGIGLPEEALAQLYHGGFESFVGERRALDADKTLALCRWWREKAEEGRAKNREDYDAVMARIEKALAK